MIQITCTSCQTVLQIDEGFAGGVCRCKFCGTIQTVPKHMKGSGDAPAYAEESTNGGGAKTIFQKKTGADGPSGTGLDDLAGIVASSGLSSNRLRKGGTTAGAKTTTPVLAPAGNKKMLIIAGGAGAVIALLLGVIIFMAVRDKSGGNKDNEGGGTVQQTVVNSDGSKTVVTVAKRGPAFLGQPLMEKSVVYILDHGQSSATENRLERLKEALLASVKSLGPQRQFAVMFWNTDGKNAWPPEGLRPATPENIEALKASLDDVMSFGVTKLPGDVDKAFASGAGAVVLVPIKAAIPDEVPATLAKARAGKPTKIYTFSLEQPDLAPALKKISADTGGAYRDVSMQDLRSAGE